MPNFSISYFHILDLKFETMRELTVKGEYSINISIIEQTKRSNQTNISCAH